MGFLSPMLLASLGALLVPLWLHLRRKRRQTPMEFPSLRYIKMAAARMKRQARVEDMGLLLLRVLLVALLALAFARPVMRSSGAWLGAGRSVESVVVIDATASMNWRGGNGSRFDLAKRLAREWIEGLDRADGVALWILTDRLERPVPVPIADRAHVFEVLDALKPTEGSASLAPVFNAAREWAETRSAGRKEFVIITDNQAAVWDWPAEGFFKKAWNRSATNLVVLEPDRSDAPNISIASVEWDGSAVREGGMLNGVVKLANHGSTVVKDLLEVKVGDSSLLRKPVEIATQGTTDVPISFPVTSQNEAVFAGEIALAGDGLAADDHWFFALPVRRNVQSWVIEQTGGPVGSMRPSFFLTRALAAGGAGKAQVVDASAWANAATQGINSVWFTHGAIQNGDAWQKALTYADGGGTVVITADSQPDPLPQDWPVSAGSEINLPSGRVATRLMVPAHPLFDGVWNEQTPFPPLPQKTARQCRAAADAKLLVTMAGEIPLLVERSHGRGRILWLNASVDRSWGDLPLSPAYVALVQQMARASDLTLRSATTAWVGEAWPDLSAIGGDAAWPAANDGSPALRTTRSGVFSAVSKDGKPSWRCAVNVRRAESDLTPVESAHLQAMLPGRVMAGTQGIHEWREEIRREVPLWPWLLGAAALVFLTECAVSAFAAKRRTAAASGEFPKWRARRAQA